MQITQQQTAGAQNLLRNCINVQSGQSVLLIAEPDASFYNHDAVAIVEHQARQLGAYVRVVKPALINGPEAFPDFLAEEIDKNDHTIFFSRIGDNVRFTGIKGNGSKTICYALDSDLLGSDFCTVPHNLMQEMLDGLLQEMDNANEWQITCPLGTDLTGTFQTNGSRRTVKDNAFTLGTFPIVIFPPIPCDTMSGRAVITHWLSTTSNRHYEPANLVLDQPVSVFVENGKILDFEGDATTVANIRQHYDHVGSLFDIEPYNVHSWHAGVNPMTWYPRPAIENIKRWGTVAFASPRYTHFHTCGDYPPGEIAWSMFDTTISIDRKIFWRNGVFSYFQRMFSKFDTLKRNTNFSFHRPYLGI